ncbi:hypothetical protein L596_007138 [Steinernema carpocapsae]|uniref:Uncharacterized protein n=1 Tax=Steinernema carpocapsae TaxID=34508 RepID=A0A4V6A5W5_STECR|nr:hypothetical protein L596_007138 [Steinernema carpocapsae]
MVKLPDINPEPVKVLIKKLWTHDPKGRLPFKEIICFLLDCRMFLHALLPPRTEDHDELRRQDNEEFLDPDELL